MTDVLKEVRVLLYDDSIPVSPVPWFSNSCLKKMYMGMGDLISSSFFPQVSIMKRLEHHNIINLIEVIDDPESDHFYMGTQ